MLEVRDLSVRIGHHEVVVIEELDIPEGRRLGLVGESGSGKTMTAMSIAGLQPRVARVTGSVRIDGRQLIGLPEGELAHVRGADIGVIFQDPLRALNPVMRIGKQVAEAVRLHRETRRVDVVRRRVLELLEQVGLADPEQFVRRYPHQLSGGQRQRVLIAIAIASRPKLLIADEPTTALDVTVQEGILELLTRLSIEEKMGLLFVSHDLGVVAAISETVAVMYGGRLVEIGPIGGVIGHPQHRYTEALIASNPGIAPTNVGALLGRPLRVIRGSVPPLGGFPNGCRFRGRCSHELEVCAGDPPTTIVGAEHQFRCWNPTTNPIQEVNTNASTR